MLIYDTLTIVLLYVPDDLQLKQVNKDFYKACSYNRRILLNVNTSKDKLIKTMINKLPSDVLENLVAKYCKLQTLINQHQYLNIIEFNDELKRMLYKPRDDNVYKVKRCGREMLAYGFNIKSCDYYRLYKTYKSIEADEFVDDIYSVVDESQYVPGHFSSIDVQANFIEKYEYETCYKIIQDGAHYMVLYHLTCDCTVPQNFEEEVTDMIYDYDLYDNLNITNINNYAIELNKFMGCENMCVMVCYNNNPNKN
jgi:hypothetical protein